MVDQLPRGFSALPIQGGNFTGGLCLLIATEETVDDPTGGPQLYAALSAERAIDRLAQAWFPLGHRIGRVCYLGRHRLAVFPRRV